MPHAIVGAIAKLVDATSDAWRRLRKLTMARARIVTAGRARVQFVRAPVLAFKWDPASFPRRRSGELIDDSIRRDGVSTAREQALGRRHPGHARSHSDLSPRGQQRLETADAYALLLARRACANWMLCAI
jgi:hypothetical protein